MRDGHDAALLLDFNGVIVDDEEQHRASLEAMLAEHGIGLTRDQYYADYLGWNDRMSFVIAFRQAGRALAPERLDGLVAEKSRRYGAMIERSLTLVPGVREFVERAALRFRLGVVSGALRHEIEHVLEVAGLRPLFEVIVAADDVATCKPDPEGYLAAHAALAQHRPLARGACIAIEDSLPGLAAARAAGMRCIMLATNLAPAALAGADAVWTSFVGHDPAQLLPGHAP
jgi:HAD superfamily hydrolase (TIGR01509 family)